MAQLLMMSAHAQHTGVSLPVIGCERPLQSYSFNVMASKNATESRSIR